MKKIIAMMMVAVMLLAMVACATVEEKKTTEPAETKTTAPAETKTAEQVKVMTYDEFVAAAVEEKVCVETYIQAKQGWWEKDGVGVATFYTQNQDGAYFVYEMPCSEDDYNTKLVAGAKIRVTGFKAEWSGEIEIIDATYEVLEGTWTAEAKDLTDKLGTDDLIKYQNQLAIFKGMTVEKIAFKNEQPGNDIYVTVKLGDASYDFCVESYLTGADTDVYAAVSALKAGDKVDIEGFVYWYEGVNTHITEVTPAA